jgi:predicted Zn-dependent peptidase
MILRHRTLTFAAAAGLFALVAAPVASQTTIQVEESTGTRATAPNAPIEISIPRNRPAEIHVTTVTREAARQPQANESGSINLTPAQFRARRTQENLPVVPPPSASTPVPPSPAQLEAEAGTTPTAGILPQQLPAADDDGAPAPPPQFMHDAQATSHSEELPSDMSDPDAYTTVTAPAAHEDVGVTTASADSAPYLAPADYGTQKTMPRGAATVPMLPGLLTSTPLTATVPDVAQTTLPNAMKFFHYESRDLPRVRLNLVVDAGQNADPADKIGLADLTARTLRSAGSGSRSADEVDEALDQIGGELNIAVERDHMAISMFLLTERLASGTALLSDILVRPQFDAQKFEQQRARMMEDLRRQNDNPAEISRREFRKLVYGKTYPLARTPTSATLSAITLDDVRAFYEAHYRPSTIWAGVSGDISNDDAKQLVEKTFAGWDRPAGERVPMPPQVTDLASSAGVYLTPKATAQAQIRMGHLGIPRRSEEAYAVNVLNSVYGMGGFSSRLMNTVRTKYGYVYGVGGAVLSDDPTGLFFAVASSKSATTVAAIKEMLNVTKEIVSEGISAAELETAKRDVIFNFISEFETPEEIVRTHMLYDFRGYAPDYLKKFPERIRAVNADQVHEVARKFMHPDELVIYVVGNPAELDSGLDQFGTVHTWDLDSLTAAPGD